MLSAEDSGALRALGGVSERVRDLDGRLTLPVAVILAFFAFRNDQVGEKIDQLSAQFTTLHAVVEGLRSEMNLRVGHLSQQSGQAVSRVNEVEERLRALEQQTATSTGHIQGELDAFRTRLGVVEVKAGRADDRARKLLEDSP